MDRSGAEQDAGTTESPEEAPGSAVGGVVGSVSALEIRSWLVEHLASLLDIPEHEVSVTSTFDEYGLDSAAAVAMTGELARWLRVDLDANLASEHPTIEAVALHLAGKPRPPR
jgi:acyl carrier protein